LLNFGEGPFTRYDEVASPLSDVPFEGNRGTRKKDSPVRVQVGFEGEVIGGWIECHKVLSGRFIGQPGVRCRAE
jgi:hypothetical protein